MKLILVVDRDDDIGRKAGVLSPVIGREDNFQAAIKLGLSDPEDSDVNAIFQALKLYDSLKDKEDVEIVTVSGDENVGVVSDTKIAQQLDEIKEKIKAKKVIVVTDGSEDEFVLPIISSKFEIESISRVIVKQSKTIESTYYLIKRMLNDPKIAKATLVPLGVAFIIYAIFSLIRLPELGSGAIIFFLGLYMILKAYGMDSMIEEYFLTLKKSLMEGRITFITYLIGLILFIVGLIQGFNILWKVYNQPVSQGLIILLVSFIYGAVWWIASSSFVVVFGKIIDALIEGRSLGRYKSLPFLIISTGILIWGSSVFILSTSEAFSYLRENAMALFLFSVFGAFIIGAIGIIPLRAK